MIDLEKSLIRKYTSSEATNTNKLHVIVTKKTYKVEYIHTLQNNIEVLVQSFSAGLVCLKVQID